MAQKYNVDELRKTSKMALQNRTNELTKASQLAFDTIVKDADSKIKTAMANGRFRAYLYIWHYVPDDNDRKFTFNNFRIMDIVSKSDLIDKLRDHFSSSNDDGLYVDWHKFKLPDNNGNSKYGIYVSWAEHKGPSSSTTDENGSVAATSTTEDNESAATSTTATSTVKKVKALKRTGATK